MADELPSFRFHPDPVATGAVEVRTVDCVACGRLRSHAYAGPVYAPDELDDDVCPWCIADGTAAERFEAEFTDVGVEVPDGVDEDALAELAERTPGFSGWQQEHWLYHCDLPAAFLGTEEDGDTATYRFRCLTCGTDMSYADSA